MSAPITELPSAKREQVVRACFRCVDCLSTFFVEVPRGRLDVAPKTDRWSCPEGCGGTRIECMGEVRDVVVARQGYYSFRLSGDLS